MVVATGSIICVLSAPHDALPRYFDDPPALRHAGARLWTCGCIAEPHKPGIFTVAAGDVHTREIESRHWRLHRAPLSVTRR